MADIVLDVGLKLTPDSIRSVQSDVRSAFRNISPQIDIDETSLKRQVEHGIRQATIASLKIGEIVPADGAAFRFSKAVSQNIKIKVNRLEAARAAINDFKRQIEEQSQIAVRAQIQAGETTARQAQERAKGGTFDTVAVNTANKKAADEASKLAQLQAQLRFGYLELSKEVKSGSRAFGKLKGAAARAARVQLQGIEQQQSLTGQRSQLARALLAARKASNQELVTAAITKQAAKFKRERLSKEAKLASLADAAQRKVTAAKEKEARALEAEISKLRKSDDRIRQFAANLPDKQERGTGLVASSDAITNAKANRELNKSLGNRRNATRGANSAQLSLNKSTTQGNAATGAFTSSLGTATKRLALYAAASQLVFGLIGALSAAKDEIIALDEQSRRLTFFSEGGSAFDEVAGALNNLGDATQANTENFNGLLQASIRTGISLQKTTEILTTVARVGQEVNGTFANSVTSLVRLEAGALGAEKAVTNLNAIQIQFLNTLRRYNDEGEDAIDVTESISNIQAVLASTAGRSAANVEQLSSAVTRVGSALSQIQGLNANATIAILGEAFNTTGANASRLGTSFRQLGTLIVQNAEQIRELSGIEVLGQGGQIKGFESIIEVLERVNELQGTAAGIELLKQIADRRNLADVQALAAGVETLKGKFGDFTSAAGEQRLVLEAVGRAYDADVNLAAGLGAQIEKLKSGFIALTSSPIKGFLTDLTTGLNNVIGFAKSFASAISQAGQSFGELFGESFEVENIFQPWADLLREIQPSLLIIAKALVVVGATAIKVTGFIISGFAKGFEAINKFIDAAKELESFLGIGAAPGEVEAAKAREASLKKEETLRQALLRLQAEQSARAKKDVELGRRELARIERIRALRAEALQLSQTINNENTTANTRLSAQIALRAVEAELTKTVAKNTEEARDALAGIINLQQALNNKKADEAKISASIKSIDELINSTLNSREAITIPIQFNTASIEREISSLEEDLVNLGRQQRLAIRATDSDKRAQIEREISRIQRDVAQKQSEILQNNIKVQEGLLKTTTDEAKLQAAAFKTAGDQVANSFKEVVSAQESISDIFSRQGQSIQNIIRSSGEQTARFLDATGASIEQRLSNIVDTSSRQIAEIRRTQRRQQGTLQDAGNIGQAVNTVISSLRSVNRAATTNLFTDIRNFERDVNTLRIRNIARNSQAELNIRINAAQRDITIRKNAIEQEIRVINERIAAERTLNDLRVNQQREFGRLLLEAPDKFVETVQDINVAEQFFRGITDLSVESLRTIQQRSQQLRGGGQSETLARVLKGLQASGRFGGGDVVSGIGNKQLQSVFERIQLSTPQDLANSLTEQERLLKSQTVEQQRIKQLQEEAAGLDRESVSLQQSRIKLAAATAAIAAKQRNDLNKSLQTLIANNATNFANLLKARGAAREAAVNQAGGNLTASQNNALERQKNAEIESLNEAHRQRGVAKKTLEQLNKENNELIANTKNTSSSLSDFGKKLAGFTSLDTSTGVARQGVQTSDGGVGSTTLDSSTKGVFQEIGRSLRPLTSGRLQIVSPQLTKLRAAVEKTGGTREQRGQLRRLEAQSRNTISGGAEGQGRQAAGRFLRDEQTAARVEQGFRALLQDRQGGSETDFVTALRELRGEGRRGAGQVDAEALRRLLGSQGLGGVAGDVNTSRQGAQVIDRLLRLSDELSENQKSLSREAGKEIKKILSEEVTEGIRALRKVVSEAQDGAEAGTESQAGRAALTTALNKFSIANPEQIARLNTEIKKAFSDASTELNAGLKAAGQELGKELKSTLEGGSLKITIPENEQIGLNLSVNLANGITSADFARDLATQLESAGFGDKELREKIVKQLQVITAPLIKNGLIVASPEFVTNPNSDKSGR